MRVGQAPEQVPGGNVRPQHYWKILVWFPVPLLFLWLSIRHERELIALRDRGQVVQGVTVRCSSYKGKEFLHYKFVAEGVTVESNVETEKLGVGIGDPIAVRYLPERPKAHWVGPPIDAKTIVDETHGPRMAAYVGLGFLSLVLVLNLVRQRQPAAVDEAWLRIRNRWFPPVFTLLLMTMAVWTSFSPRVRAVQEGAFGPKPLGIPNLHFVILLQLVVLLPFFWISTHLLRVMNAAVSDGVSPRGARILLYLLTVGRTHPHLKRSQAVVAVGLLYTIALCAAWIVLSTYRGV